METMSGSRKYVRLSDLREVLGRLYASALGSPVEERTLQLVSQAIKELETVDAEPVVRCGECKHFQLNAWGTVNGVPLIVAHEICDLWAGGCKTSPDGYCSYGERKDGADNG
jgi:hypothetical protein